MKFKIIKKKSLKEKTYGDIKVTDIINERAIKFSLAKVEKVGDDKDAGFDLKSDISYYILDGEGKAIVNGKEYELKKGDCVFYPKGTKYKHSKGMAFLAISCPKFDAKNRVYVKK